MRNVLIVAQRYNYEIAYFLNICKCRSLLTVANTTSLIYFPKRKWINNRISPTTSAYGRISTQYRFPIDQIRKFWGLTEDLTRSKSRLPLKDLLTTPVLKIHMSTCSQKRVICICQMQVP